VTASPQLPDGLAAVLSRARNLVVVTGAGMSTESGVPVFRGPGGLWEGSRPEDLATPLAFARDPERVWRWYRWRLDRVEAARPHPGHLALADLEASGDLDRFTLITQNVDGLHQRAGNRRVIELHGAIHRARCTGGCGRTARSLEVDPARCRCPGCSGRLRPDVVWFGENLDPAVLGAAVAAVEACDLLWVVGTSALVHPAAGLGELAADRGTPVVEVNPEPTPLSDRVALRLPLPAARGVPLLAAEIGRRPAAPGSRSRGKA